jgi:hypothetical protein
MHLFLDDFNYIYFNGLILRNTKQANKLLATEMDFGEDPLENQGKKWSEMSPLERSWRCGRTF